MPLSVEDPARAALVGPRLECPHEGSTPCQTVNESTMLLVAPVSHHEAHACDVPSSELPTSVPLSPSGLHNVAGDASHLHSAVANAACDLDSDVEVLEIEEINVGSSG